MADDKTLIFKIELDVDDYIKAAADAGKTADELKKKQKELADQGKIGSAEFEENAAKLREANTAYREAQKTVDNVTKAKKEQTGSIKQLRAEIAVLTANYNKMTEAERNSVEGQQFAKGLEQKVEKLKAAEQAVGDYRRNVGNYSNSMKDALSATNTFGGGMNALSGIMKLAPFGIVIVAIEKLFGWFSKLQPVMDKINEIMGGLGEVMDVVAARASNLVDAVGALFSGDFEEANKQYAATWVGLADAIGQAYDAGVNYAKVQKEIDDMNQVIALNNAQAEKQIASLTLQAKDRTKSEAERLAILDDITKIETTRFKTEEENLKKAADLEEQKLKRLLKQRGVNTELIKSTQDLIKAGQDRAIEDEILKKVVDSQVALTNAQKESISITERANARRNALLEQERAEREKSHQDYLKKLEERRKKEEEEQKKSYQQKRAGLEVELMILEEGGQMWINKKIELLKAERDQELQNKQLTSNQKLLIDAKYADAIVQVYQDAEKINLDNAKKAMDQKLQSLTSAAEREKLLATQTIIQRKTELDAEFESGKISRQQYNLEIQAIDNDAALKAKELKIAELEERKLLYEADSLERLRIETEIQDLIQQKNAETHTIERENIERTKALERQSAQARLAVAQSVFGNLATLFEEGSEEYKAFALLQAGASTAQGAIGAFSQASSAYPPPYGQILGAVAAAAVVAAGLVQMKKITELEQGGVIFPKAAKGMILGGEPHSRGGTKFVGSDGTRFEAEKGELLAVVNKRNTRLLNGLNWLNMLNGNGNNFFESGGLRYLADGGFAVNGMTSSVNNLIDQRNAVSNAVLNLPQPIVLVEDINSAQGTMSRVQSRGEI